MKAKNEYHRSGCNNHFRCDCWIDASNHGGEGPAIVEEFCLGCNKSTANRDCGCPAGTGWRHKR